MVAAAIYVGIDVSKDRLDVAVLPGGKKWHCPHTETGIAALAQELGALAPTLVVLEATGGIELPLAGYLGALGMPLVIANPRQVRDFARSTGELAKTDRIDAGILALFAERVRPEPRPVPDAAAQELDGLVARRRQIVEMLVAEKNRMRTASKRLHKSIQRHVDWLHRSLDEVDRDLGDAVRGSPLWREKDELLQSVPGVGKVLSTTLVAGMPELGALGHKQIAALAGLAPFNLDSGRLRGRRAVWGGRAPVRAALYMGTLTATRHNPVIRGFYQRLLATGKAKKVALVACMRKLLTILNAMLKHKTAWRVGVANV